MLSSSGLNTQGLNSLEQINLIWLKNLFHICGEEGK